jgi:hypothetical protein
MRYLAKCLFFLTGLAAALVAVGVVGELPGYFGKISVLSLAVTIFFFLKSDEAAFVFAAGAAIGLGSFSGYGFTIWIVVAAAICGAGYFVSHDLLTDQSLFALLSMNAILHAVLFVSEYAASNLINMNSSIKLIFDLALLKSGLVALLMETVLLYLFFIGYQKTRAKRTGRLIHIR